MNTKNTKANSDELGELITRTPQVLSKSYTSTVIEIYLDSEIGSPEKYREAYHALSNASHQDIVMLHVNTLGGRLDAGVQLINHINNCQAKVVGVLHMEAASMGSAIFLACDDWELNEFSTMMVHSCSYGAAGKQSDIRSRVDFTTAFNERFIRKNYTGFLSEAEIQRALNGDDLYFDYEQIDDRLEKFREYREMKEQEEIAGIFDEDISLLDEAEEVVVELVEKPSAKPKAVRKPKAKPAE